MIEIFTNDAEAWEVLYNQQLGLPHRFELESEKDSIVNDFMELGHRIGENRRLHQAIEDMRSVLRDLS